MPLSVHLGYSPSPESLAYLQERLDDSIVLTHGSEPPDPASYHLLVSGRPSTELLQASPNLHTLLIPFAGLPAITKERMQDYPRVAIHNLHHNATPTAEMALGLMLAAAKLIVPSDRDFRQHDWTPRYRPNPSVLLSGKTVLILGYGALGRRVGVLCRALDMTVLGVRRHESTEDEVYAVDQLHNLLPRADVLMVCLPGTDATTGLISD